MEQSYNARCPAVKRLLREAQELHEATEEYYALPLEDNLFEWHFTVRGPPQTEFDGGIYHGRIVMPPEYPMKPPNIIFTTPNGRFEINKKICLSISGHHPETWQPSWSIRTALLAIIGFMPTPANGTIGSLEYTAAERGLLAKKSLDFNCTECGCVGKLLRDRTSNNEDLQREAREVLTQVAVATKNENTSESEVKSTTNVDNSTTVIDDKDSNSTTTIKLPNSEISGENGQDDLLMEGATTTSSSRETSTSSQTGQQIGSTRESSSGFLHNFILSAAVFLFVALLLRRLFLLETDSSDEIEEILL